MDVDLLRPGTVPISPDTSLWFEFLLEPSHLEKHIKNPNGDPTPTELITKFLTLSQNEKPSNGELIPADSQKPLNKRCFALKILALKVVAHLKWNLELLEKSLSLGNQLMLLKDFLFVVNPLYADVGRHVDLKLAGLPSHVLFSIYIYHRWLVRAFVKLTLHGRSKQLPEPPPEEINEKEAEKSAKVLTNIVDQHLTLLAPAPSCFALPTEESDPGHDWSEGEILEGKKLALDLLKDVTLYFVDRGKYLEARSLLKRSMAGSLASSPCMTGLSIAVGVRPKQYSPSLCQQFHECIAAKYIDIDKVLEKDNELREIPIVYRQGLELDISSEVANGKLFTARDGVALIRAQNAIRTAMDGGVQLHGPPLAPQALVKAISAVLPLSESDKGKLEYYFLQLLASLDPHASRTLVSHISKLHLLSPEQIASVTEQDYVEPVPHIQLDVIDTSEPSPRTTSIKTASLERLVLTSYDPVEIRTALCKLSQLNENIAWDKLNRNWDIPQPISHSMMALKSTDVRYFVHIMIAKSYELDHVKNYAQAKVLLGNALEEISGEDNVDKLKQCLLLEILLIDIHQFHSTWPVKNMDWTEMTERCLAAIPLSICRTAVREAACAALVNTGAWASLVNTSLPKSPLTEVYLAVAKGSLSLSTYSSKICTDAWEKIIPFFSNGKHKRDNGALKGLTDILELNALSIIISVLARLYNVINDQPPLDLYVPLTQLWPGTLKNSNQYNIKQVSETLMETLEHALEHYPYNIPWLKLMGDLHFVNGHYRSALSSYLEAAAVGTEHFSRPLHRNLLEDHVIKRMIKSCTQLQCHTQAGLLCQLLEETDYTTAYKCFSELNTADASDSYYKCIWDVNILEYLIALHAKKGEQHRKNAVVRMIGLLELNSNNNDEIKREAENIRKSHFLRAMAAQYL